MSDETEGTVWVCDECQSWTDRPTTRPELLTVWGWEVVEIDGEPELLCPDCQ